MCASAPLKLFPMCITSLIGASIIKWKQSNHREASGETILPDASWFLQKFARENRFLSILCSSLSNPSVGKQKSAGTVSVKETFTQWYLPSASDIASQRYSPAASDIFAAQMWMAGHPHPFRFALFCRGGSPCPPDNFHLLCVNNNSCGVLLYYVSNTIGGKAVGFSPAKAVSYKLKNATAKYK